MTNRDDSAFTNERSFEIGDHLRTYPCQSLTKREYFAAMAMQGILAGDPQDFVEIAESDALRTADAIGLTALEIADALIEALNK